MYKICLLLILCTATVKTNGLECLKCLSVEVRGSVPFWYKIPVNAALGAFTSTNCASAKTDSSHGVSQRTCPRNKKAQRDSEAQRDPKAKKVYKCGMFTGTAKVNVIVTSVSVRVVIRNCFLVDKSFEEGTCSSDMSIVDKQLESIASAINAFSFNLATLKGRFCINRSTRNQFPFWMLVFMFFTATFILN